LSGFIGEFATILGTFNAGCDPTDTVHKCIAGQTFPAVRPSFLPAPHVLGALAATGVILGAIYLLYMFQKVFFGKLDKARNGSLPDLTGRELGTFVPLGIGIFLMGLFPRPFLSVMEKSVFRFVTEQKERLKECVDRPVH